MHLSECVQCGRQAAFVIDIADLHVEEYPDLEGRVRVHVTNYEIYIGAYITTTGELAYIESLVDEKLKDEVMKFLASSDVALCPKCMDTCDILTNFVASTVPVHWTKTLFY